MVEVMAKILDFFSFNDAQRAMGEGVFTITSVAGYSIDKSLFFYATFLVLVVAIAFILVKLFKQFFDNLSLQGGSQESLILPKLKTKEYIFLLVVIVVIGAANIMMREKIFDINTYYTEEFYNLAATNELRQDTFSIIYPYSIGNLFIASAMRNFGFNLIYYKIFLNALALIVIYICLAAFINKIRYRLLIFIWLISLFFWSFIGPTLHANVLRLFLPVISAILLFHCTNKYQHSWQKKLVALSLLFFAILFFGAADSIAVFLVLYALFSLYQFLITTSIKEKLIFVIAPLLAVAAMFVIFGTNYTSLFANQIRSISFYSGHPNAAPYYNLFAVFNSLGIGDFVKNSIYTLIFYLPFVIMAGLILYLMVLGQRKEERLKERFACVVLLLFTFLLYYRQNFGNAGPGRVVAASTVLVFILLAIQKYYQQNKIQKIILVISAAFFFISTLIGFYFLRYSLIYLYDAHQNRLTAKGLVACSEMSLGKELSFTGFTNCNEVLVEELIQVKAVVKDKDFYVYDDTFGLYYLLGARPVTLMPSLYMAYTKESIIIDKLKKSKVEYMIYPRQNHFFGVPEVYYKDQRFMTNINLYRDDNFKRVFVSPMFEIFQLIK
jgi:hypothetical protein